uniref:ORF44a n=1 Tax=Pinus koraiensis TaxID=88728 RepID=Q85X63_PINKO|nr:ORF44a [Pinus koraiensis]AAO74000.1 ORF44a [Pinus koraiensis]
MFQYLLLILVRFPPQNSEIKCIIISNYSNGIDYILKIACLSSTW